MTAFDAPIRTARLTLIPSTAAHIEAELAGLDVFSRMLDVVVPASWPPGEYDEGAQRYFLDCLNQSGPAGIGWFGWYAVRPADGESPATVVAGGGYFGPPTAEGVVEIGYSVCPEWRARGYATELAAALAAHAAAQPGVTRVIAHTTATNAASVLVLERSGFRAIGENAERQAMCFEYGAVAAG